MDERLGVITLYQYPTSPEVPNLSPFCMKAETWLKLAGLPYEISWLANPRKAPHGKLPYIVDGADVVADSHNIIEHLSKKYSVDLDKNLSAEQKAQARAFERLLSDHLYWAGIIHPRWAEPRGWAQVKPVFFGPLPAPLRGFVANLVRKKTLGYLDGQGLGRIPPDEIRRRAEQDIQALADYLGGKAYFMGAEATNADAGVYAFLANLWECHFDTPLKAVVGKHRNLVEYCARMRARCFPDMKK